jgi:thiol-disulfide isomerase/thioredoxin
MQLKDEQDQPKTVDLTKDKKISVVVFFATWCPHCQNEMPRLVEFYEQLNKSKYKNSVQLIAVRASTAREVQSFADFKKEYKIPFPILTDEGIAFETFASEQKKSPGFPMMAITDSQGSVSFFLSHGDHNDTAKELFWIIESLK